MTAGQVWRRTNGVRWVEVQADTMEPSGWRVMVPLADPFVAPYAPPLVIQVGEERARVHLLTTAPVDELGVEDGEIPPEDIASLREAIRALIRDP
jgi:hypothetical protein